MNTSQLRRGGGFSPQAYANQVVTQGHLAVACWCSAGVFQRSLLRDMTSVVDDMAALAPVFVAQSVIATPRC